MEFSINVLVPEGTLAPDSLRRRPFAVWARGAPHAFLGEIAAGIDSDQDRPTRTTRQVLGKEAPLRASDKT